MRRDSQRTFVHLYRSVGGEVKLGVGGDGGNGGRRTEGTEATEFTGRDQTRRRGDTEYFGGPAHLQDDSAARHQTEPRFACSRVSRSPGGLPCRMMAESFEIRPASAAFRAEDMGGGTMPAHES